MGWTHKQVMDYFYFLWLDMFSGFCPHAISMAPTWHLYGPYYQSIVPPVYKLSYIMIPYIMYNRIIGHSPHNWEAHPEPKFQNDQTPEINRFPHSEKQL